MSGFFPPFIPPFINQNRTAIDLLVGETPPTGFPFSIEIDGSTIGLNQMDNSSLTHTDPRKRLNLKLDEDNSTIFSTMLLLLSGR